MIDIFQLLKGQICQTHDRGLRILYKFVWKCQVFICWRSESFVIRYKTWRMRFSWLDWFQEATVNDFKFISPFSPNFERASLTENKIFTIRNYYRYYFYCGNAKGTKLSEKGVFIPVLQKQKFSFNCFNFICSQWWNRLCKKTRLCQDIELDTIYVYLDQQLTVISNGIYIYTKMCMRLTAIVLSRLYKVKTKCSKKYLKKLSIVGTFNTNKY